MHPILFHYFSVKIPLVEFPILKTVFVLFLFCIPQNICEGIAKVNNPDLFPLCRTDFVLMGSTIVADAPAYSEILFFKVDILPCQTCYLSKSETCKVCYLNRKNRIPTSFSKLFSFRYISKESGLTLSLSVAVSSANKSVSSFLCLITTYCIGLKVINCFGNTANRNDCCNTAENDLT